MSQYRHRLPQLNGELFLTDGGLETTLIFHEHVDLPYFAAFDLLKNAEGLAVLRRYFESYAAVARRQELGLVLETPTWRANPDWTAKLDYDATMLADANRSAVGLLLEIRARWETPMTQIVISGNLGPRGDGYRPDARMTVDEAPRRSHAELDASTDLDAGNPEELARDYRELRRMLPGLAVAGGCCGTDHRHVEAMGVELKSR